MVFLVGRWHSPGRRVGTPFASNRGRRRRTNTNSATKTAAPKSRRARHGGYDKDHSTDCKPTLPNLPRRTHRAPAPPISRSEGQPADQYRERRAVPSVFPKLETASGLPLGVPDVSQLSFMIRAAWSRRPSQAISGYQPRSGTSRTVRSPIADICDEGADTISATMKLTTKPTPFVPADEGRSRAGRTWKLEEAAPIMVGTARKKENSAAVLRFTPIASAPMIVAPERLTRAPCEALREAYPITFLTSWTPSFGSTGVRSR